MTIFAVRVTTDPVDHASAAAGNVTPALEGLKKTLLTYEIHTFSLSKSVIDQMG